MGIARVLSRAEQALDAPLVQVEVHLGRGLPGFTIVGLPAPVVRESRERVRAALLSSGFEFPARRITVNLAPVELVKQGGRFDLPIALGLLLASEQLTAGPTTAATECYGELGLDGELRAVSGLFLAALQASRARHGLIVPRANAREVSLSGHSEAFGAVHLRAAGQLLTGERPRGAEAMGGMVRIIGHAPAAVTAVPTLQDVIGQLHAKRALAIAAAGGHSLLMVGPPGSGKSLLASCLSSLLPPLTSEEALEVAGLATLAGLRIDADGWGQRPFRAPHHTSSVQAIVGSTRRPGEISLAHRGVLFLDELPEFDRRVLEALREPLESGSISIARAASRLQLPARFQLVAAMNPCPCGYLGDALVVCRCTPSRTERYRRRLSGPLLDRIDLRVVVARLPPTALVATATASDQRGVDIAQLTARVLAARGTRIARSGAPSAGLSAPELRACCALPPASAQLLRRSCERLALSGRGVQRLLAVSRTIADLDGSERIEPPHLAEAIQLRRPDYWPTSDSM